MKLNSVVFAGIIFVIFSLIILGCGDKNTDNNTQQHEITTQTGSEIVREFDVEVKSLDNNEDGKVFQCPMDWQVISDEAGSCPLCNMKLKEYSVEDAQLNLKEHKQHMH